MRAGMITHASAALTLRPWPPPCATGSSQELADFCAAHPVDEKILLVPSFSVGQQVLDALARSGAAHLNLRPATVFSLAHGVAGPALAAEGKRLLSRAQLLAVVESACDEVLGPDSYFGALRRSVGLHRALHRTLDELRRARVTPADLGSAGVRRPAEGRGARGAREGVRDDPRPARRGRRGGGPGARDRGLRRARGLPGRSAAPAPVGTGARAPRGGVPRSVGGRGRPSSRGRVRREPAGAGDRVRARPERGERGPRRLPTDPGRGPPRRRGRDRLRRRRDVPAARPRARDAVRRPLHARRGRAGHLHASRPGHPRRPRLRRVRLSILLPRAAPRRRARGSRGGRAGRAPRGRRPRRPPPEARPHRRGSGPLRSAPRRARRARARAVRARGVLGPGGRRARGEARRGRGAPLVRPAAPRRAPADLARGGLASRAREILRGDRPGRSSPSRATSTAPPPRRSGTSSRSSRSCPSGGSPPSEAAGRLREAVAGLAVELHEPGRRPRPRGAPRKRRMVGTRVDVRPRPRRGALPGPAPTGPRPSRLGARRAEPAPGRRAPRAPRPESVRRARRRAARAPRTRRAGGPSCPSRTATSSRMRSVSPRPSSSRFSARAKGTRPPRGRTSRAPFRPPRPSCRRARRSTRPNGGSRACAETPAAPGIEAEVSPRVSVARGRRARRGGAREHRVHDVGREARRPTRRTSTRGGTACRSRPRASRSSRSVPGRTSTSTSSTSPRRRKTARRASG